jgi:8-oxo-dGTP pyrophosphatase MutT (NUDIX family)
VTLPKPDIIDEGAADWPVVSIRHLDLKFVPRAWPFAEKRRPEIDAYFAARQRANPALWNGRVLAMHTVDIQDDALRGAYLETDFASFLAWRDWGFPDPHMRNCFGMAALRSRDGAFLLGVMGPHTANPGRAYFPAGTPDPSDIVGDRVDIEGNIRRELMEETGLELDTLQAEPEWHAVLAGPRIALMKVLWAPDDAATLRARMLAHIAAEREPELSDIRIVREPRDLDAAVPTHMTAFLRSAWRRDRR